MKTFIIITAVLIVCSSCDKTTVGQNISRSDTMNRGAKGTESGSGRSGIYLTAVCFDGDYDWRKDSDYGRAAGHILLIRNKETVLSIDAGGDSEVSTAADLHHFVAGHIYTEYFNGTHTIYKKDGEVCLKAEGQEAIRGILARDTVIYVLSEKIPDKGFVLREDWKEILSRKNGTVHGSPADPSFGRCGALYEDEGALCFCYFKRNAGPGQWFIVADGEETEPVVSTSVSKVLDMRRIKGKNCLVTAFSDGRSPVLFLSGRLHDLSKTLGKTAAATDYRLWLDNDRIMVIGTYDGSQTGIWSQRELLRLLPGDCSLHNGPDYISRTAGIVQSINMDGEEPVDLQERYRVMMPRCVEWTSRGPLIALTPDLQGYRPALWKGGILTEYEFNGYFTSVTEVN